MAAAAAGLLLVPLAPASGASGDLEQARSERARIQQRLDDAAQRLGALQAHQAELEAHRDELRQQRDQLNQELAAASDRISTRVRALYKQGAAGLEPVLGVLAGDNPEDVAERAALVQHMVIGDRAASEVAAASRTRLDALSDRLRQQEAALGAAVEEQGGITARIQEDLEEAAALERRLEEQERQRREEERRRAEAAARAREAVERAQAVAVPQVQVAAAGAMACPVAPPRSFSDTWGDPRSGGRRHTGTDILAPRGADVHAIVAGTVDIRSTSSLAGNWLILRGVDGNAYYYIHLQGFAVGDGARVPAGGLIAYNGDTGNARGTPHVHFEYHPGGGGAINPYPLLRRVCG